MLTPGVYLGTPCRQPYTAFPLSPIYFPSFRRINIPSICLEDRYDNSFRPQFLEKLFVLVDAL